MISCPKKRSRRARGDIYRNIIIKKENLNPWQWMEKHVVLTKSDKRGAFRTSFNPIWRLVFEFLVNPYIRQLTIMGGVQFGKTQFMNNAIMWHIANGRGEIMYVGQSEKDVLKWKKTKYDPDEAECKIVQKLKTQKRQGSYVVQYDTCNLMLAWGNSESSTASSTISLLLGDEIDKYKHVNKKDVHPIHAILKRIKGVENPLAVLTSTPTVEDGAINQQYKLGSQHRPEVKCQKCGTWQELDDLSRLKFSDEARNEKGNYDMDLVKDSAYIECLNEKCLHRITEEERRYMIEKTDELVRLTSNNPSASKHHVSINISRFYTFLNTTIGDIAVEYLEKKDKPDGLKDFFTQVMAVPYQHKAVTNTESEIITLQERTPIKYHRSPRQPDPVELPFKPVRIMTTCDVQGDHFWIMQSAITDQGHIAILDWAQVWSQKEVYQWGRRTYSHEGRKQRSSLNFIDSGYKAKASGGIYQFIIKAKGEWHPCVGRRNELFEKIQNTEAEYRGVQFQLYSFQDDFFKELTYFHRIKALSPEQLWLPEQIDNELIDQLTNEQKVQDFNTLGEEEYKWKCKTHPANNHLGDCLKMQLVIFEKFAEKILSR